MVKRNSSGDDGANRITLGIVDNDAYICISVAKALSRPMDEILKQPWGVTLWTWMELQEVKRIDRLLEEGDDINRAALTSIAFNQPKDLKNVQYEWQKKVGIIDDAETTFAKLQKMFNENQ